MFSRISQLGKTFTEELEQAVNNQRGNPASSSSSGSNSSSTQSNSPQALLKKHEKTLAASTPDPDSLQVQDETESSTTDESVSESTLSKDVISKLRKLQRFEDRYPELLQAYRAEKRKSALIRVFEKVLQDHTPVSSITECDELVEYLRNIGTRSQIQSEEISKLQKSLDKLQSDAVESDKLQTKSPPTVESADSYRVELEQVKERNGQLLNDIQGKQEALEALETQIAELELGKQRSLDEHRSLWQAEAEVWKQKYEEVQAVGKSDSESKALSDAISRLKIARKKESELVQEIESLKVAAEQNDTAPQGMSPRPPHEHDDFVVLREKLEKSQQESQGHKNELTAMQEENTKLLNSNNELARKLENQFSTSHGQLQKIREQHDRILQEVQRKLATTENALQESRSLAQEHEKARSDITQQLSIAQSELERAHNDLRQSVREKSRLQSEIDTLRKSLESIEMAKQAAINSSETSGQENIKLQARVSELSARCSTAQDEVSETHSQLQKRFLECKTLSRRLQDLEQSSESSIQDLNQQLRALAAEKSNMETDISLIEQRRLQEVGHLKDRLASFQDQEKERAEDLDRSRQTILELREARRTHEEEMILRKNELLELQKTVEELRKALSAAETRYSTLESNNAAMKKLVEESQLRVEKLQRTHRSISVEHQQVLQQLATSSQPTNGDETGRRDSSQQSSATSSTGTTATGAHIDVDYFRNFLLGFLERKDKRAQLLPVISNLLKFQGNDEKRFRAALT